MDGVKDEKKTDVFEIAKERFLKTKEYYDTEYERGARDVDFALGDGQWEEQERADRQEQNRPCITENLCMPFIEQVVNSAREMRPSAKVSPIDDKGDVETAEKFKGLVRNVERKSKASIAYDTSVNNSVSAGYGWLRINTAYTDPMSFDQEVRIEQVLDWQSCMLDMSSEMVDGSDAEYAFIYKDIEKEVFERQYPNLDPESFEGSESNLGLHDEDKVRIVEYFYKEYEEMKIYLVATPEGEVVLTKEQYDDVKEREGVILVDERDTKVPTVKWCKLCGSGVMEETDWLGEHIPLVPVYGKVIWHEGRLKSYSLITQAKDPQRMLNVIKSTITETVASQAKNMPYIGAAGQFESNADYWETSNANNYAYLEYDPVTMTDPVTGQTAFAPPPQKQMPMQVSPALFQIEANAKMGVNATLGMYEENRGDESNAISGIAIQSRQIRGDKATFHFIDNLASSIRHVGVILVDLIPKIYNKKQVARIINIDDKEETIIIDPTAETNPAEGIYNLTAGKYDVDVDVGPSYANQQQEFLKISTELLRYQPDYGAIAGDKIIEAAGGPYAEVIAERVRANMPPEMQSDDPMAMKLLEVTKQLQAAQKEQEMLVNALDAKKKDEAHENQIKQGELAVKRMDAETKRLEALAKVEEMRVKARGAEAEALADISEAIMDMDAENTQTKQIIPRILEKLSVLEGAIQATSQPVEGVPPA